jgi:drug/metabolite transporter (DMT)-like permease
MTQAPIAMVAALRESSVIFAVLIGALWFKEGHLRRGIVAGAVVMAGVFLLRN